MYFIVNFPNYFYLEFSQVSITCLHSLHVTFVKRKIKSREIIQKMQGIQRLPTVIIRNRKRREIMPFDGIPS